jgi:uncharacterized protein (DUF1697 family)
MSAYVILIRGINVGGKNIVKMEKLRKCLEEEGFTNISTYIASGNVLLFSEKPASEIKTQVECILSKRFELDDGYVNVLVLTDEQIQRVIENKPKGFGEQPEKFHSDVIFLMELDAAEAMKVFDPREGVDEVWPGDGVIYSQRLSALFNKSRLSKIVGTTAFKSMTVRNWNTTTKLLEMIRQVKSNL